MTDRDDILRILVSTDNHLGVWERDEVRGADSFRSLEEVLALAQREKVDFVLLGGDLFHDNKPSRQTVIRAMEIFSKACLSDQPVRFQILSDQRQNFSSGQVNFENPNYNIGLPVFTIHGNHDDPGGAENLSAVDILSSGALLNYFGKIPIVGAGVGKIRVSPVLIRKGSTRLALYGLGNLRDERLCRLFQTPGCVEWVRPAETPEHPKDSWFNLFGAKNYVRESHLARFLDLVIWGHEHECLADPWAKSKHVVVLEIKGQQWRTIKHRLETVRPFEFETVRLQDHKQLKPDDGEALTALLEARVEGMLERAARGRSAGAPELPLVRLRVDYTGFSTINTQRFGARFVGRVANPHDIILWQRAAQRRNKVRGAWEGAWGVVEWVRV
ncbi:hypothetical protein QBZ16_000607 [Prototheca wickerhamii]|uniref:Mre11 DNA-binding domain-containing protein n=1 Tax=Prototheca wickerhamii TaxID=3111 RepID=A0AAD9ILW6_PROWI|nr:hypothetical protein QBZ16_000607 [Prototheca wickerhamii]